MRRLKIFYILIFIYFLNNITSSQNLNFPVLNDFNFQILPGALDGLPGEIDSSHFSITLRDGVIIDAVKYRPKVPQPLEGWPSIIMVHGFGSSKTTLIPFCREQALHGYYTLTFSMRGQGNSTGLSNLISRTEAEDLKEIVEYVKRDSAFSSNKNNILVMGGSQGGLVPFMAACVGLNVKTILSSLAPPNFASSWIENGSIKMTLLWTIVYPQSIARYTSTVNRMAVWIYSENKDRWDSLAYWLPKDRDFMDLVPNNTVPIIIEGSWQDKFFNASGIITAASMLNNVPFKMYLGAVQGHGGDQSPSEDQWHGSFFDAWIGYWMYGIQNGILNIPNYQYASTSYPMVNGYLSFLHDSSRVWPPLGVNNMRFYFNSNGLLKSTPNYYTTEREALRNEVAPEFTLHEAVNLEFRGPAFDAKFKRSNVNFETAPLTEDVKMLGVPKLNLQYSSTSDTFCQYNFQIFEVQPNGSKRLVNRINYTDRNYSRNSVRKKSIEGPAHSHIFKAGNKIRITMTNLDETADDAWLPLEGNPFVLPVLQTGSNYINLNENTYIDIPVLNGNAIGVQNGSSTLPGEFKLSQNYPNPFNPATTIEYSLAKPDKVELKVYDMLGKEVKTLVNKVQRAGTYTVLFDASAYASGIYFYKITTNNFSDIKKMVLVK